MDSFTTLQHAYTLIAAALGAWVNAVAGGGTFLTFPLLTFFGVGVLQANMISTIALWPGAMASAFAYRRYWGEMMRELPLFIAASLAGSAIGAWLLLALPEATFETLVPYLLLFAASLLTLGSHIKKWLMRHRVETGDHPQPLSRRMRLWMACFQFIISIYGGYFGAGMGILMLAVLQFAPFKNIHEMNAVKILLGTAINAIAFFMFLFLAEINWQIASWMLVGGILGGYVGTRLSLAIPPALMRLLILVIAWGITITYWIS